MWDFLHPTRKAVVMILLRLETVVGGVLFGLRPCSDGRLCYCPAPLGCCDGVRREHLRQLPVRVRGLSLFPSLLLCLTWHVCGLSHNAQLSSVV